jgi:hypothetical protein
VVLSFGTGGLLMTKVCYIAASVTDGAWRQIEILFPGRSELGNVRNYHLSAPVVGGDWAGVGRHVTAVWLG